ncbi:MAG TPA: hypothetical protein VGQ57_06560, partial [Polyangiaceae bacterium]|nr:hypothetical protein [Polyangiaceae bacterium]
TLTGNSPLTLVNGWGQYSSARLVRVGKYGNVVRFQGAISGGTNTKFATLPTSLRPTRTVYVPTVTNGTTGRIIISTAGDMTIENPGGLSNAALFTSLDGVSFGL